MMQSAMGLNEFDLFNNKVWPKVIDDIFSDEAKLEQIAREENNTFSSSLPKLD